MALADLIANLRLDLADTEHALFSDAVLGRCLQKAAYTVARDLAVNLRVEAGELEPEPEGETADLVILAAQINACDVKRSETASAFSFSSADKSVDKTKQPEHWAKLGKDLLLRYRERVAALRPDTAEPGESGGVLLTPSGLNVLLYEQGRSL